ncbi:3-dehydroquinate synthase [Sporosarcina gallistercoris]|uniref:3-dehydroquinate synthase n=1 Tax=Sporosarcina gallistercoris TaxID=2762245 RepID=A0ABR8PFK6_9BACL|nr:3-dehydroquinate synthase [Sporosarcina gallistercoris]MBD7906953.1 3-dehydroquinate synthase [Sporosarcina gallistercoris]
MKQLTVKTMSTSYDVHIGGGVYVLFATEYKELLQHADKVGIFADATAASYHLEKLEQALQAASIPFVLHMLPGGEESKTPASFMSCHSFLLQHQFTRQSVLIAFGGGACGDLTGFVAATFMRGIPFLQCPTTILAHDSAVGGKTAINMPEGKNMVGSFHQPAGVLFRPDLFTTLPEREVRSGMAELLKHAMISDDDWTESLLLNSDFPHFSAEMLSTELLKGIRVKADIVAQDEFEQGMRKFLNFGHTLGHAVEAYFGFGKVSHGECVMIGMAYSLLLSETFGSISPGFTNRFIRFADHSGYPVQAIVDVEFNSLLQFMKMDKKVSAGELVFVLLHSPGNPFTQKVSERHCEQAYHELISRIKEEVLHDCKRNKGSNNRK